jgi:hypothetical protein
MQFSCQHYALGIAMSGQQPLAFSRHLGTSLLMVVRALLLLYLAVCCWCVFAAGLQHGLRVWWPADLIDSMQRSD